MTEEEKYLHLYDTESVFQPDYNGSVYHEPWVSLTIENHKVNYNKRTIIPFFHWGNSETGITENLSSSAATVSGQYTTNMSGLSVQAEGSYSWVTSAALSNPSGNGSFNATIQANATTTNRTAVFDIKSGSTIVAKITISQDAAPYFRWSNSSTAMTKSVSSTTTSTSINYTTNMSGLTMTSSTTYSWVSSAALSNPSGNGQVNVSMQNNTGTQRSAVFNVKKGSETVAVLTVTQEEYAPEPIYRTEYDSHIGSYVWTLGEERNSVAIIYNQVSYDDGATWETESEVDVSDDAEWYIEDTSIISEISTHRFKAVGVGSSQGSSRCEYDGHTYSKMHFWRVDEAEG
jgi:hypothetical protein